MVKVFVFSWSFLAKDINGESFCFSWSFLAKDTNSESFGRSWSFLVKVTNGESFCFYGHFWPRLLLLATLAMNTSDEGYVCDLRFWSTSGIPLWQTQIHVHWRQLLAPHCATKSSSSGKQLLAWDCKYEYTRTPVGKCWQGSTSISYPGMERVKVFRA